MQSDSREAVGFLCRWVLLGLVGGLLAGACVLLAAGSAAVHTALTCSAVLPDFVRRSATGLRLSGRFDQPLFGEGVVMFYRLPQSGQLHAAWCGGDRFDVYIPRAPAQLTHVQLVGNPYGRYAFLHQQARVWVKPAIRRAFLIDARLAVDARWQGDFNRDLDQLQRIGHVSLLYFGSFERFDKARQVLQQRYPQLPVSLGCESSDENLLTLKKTIWDYRRQGAARPLIVTGDAVLARRIWPEVTRWAAVHLLVARGMPAEPIGAVRINRSWRELSEAALRD